MSSAGTGVLGVCTQRDPATVAYLVGAWSPAGVAFEGASQVQILLCVFARTVSATCVLDACVVRVVI
jgi:hypothetical protein